MWWKFAFLVTFFVLLVIIIFAIVDINGYNQQRAAISKAIENQNQCAGSNSGICELIVDFNLPTPSLHEDLSEYDPNLATFMANLVGCVEYAFLQNSEATQPFVEVPSSLEKIKDITYNGITIGIICKSDNVLWVAFRGTRTSAEWNKDFMFQQVNYPYTSYSNTNNTTFYSAHVLFAQPQQQQQSPSPYFEGMVHQGFLDVYDSIRTQIQDVIKDFSADYTISISGHSLGGALSMIMSADDFGGKRKVCTVFGCPRVGNGTFVQFLNNSTPSIFRITNVADIICDLPPSVSPNFQTYNADVYLYSHAGKSIAFETNRGALLYNHAMAAYIDFLK